MIEKETQEYLNAIATPRIASLADFDSDVEQMQRRAPLFGAELSLELIELQQAAIAQAENAPWNTQLNNALQRTQFCASRIEKLNSLLQELRTGLKDLANDQAVLVKQAETV